MQDVTPFPTIPHPRPEIKYIKWGDGYNIKQLKEIRNEIAS